MWMYTRFFTPLRSALNDIRERIKENNPCNLWCKKTLTKTIQIMENKNIWGKILHIVITVLTAIATTFGVSSCMNLMQ